MKKSKYILSILILLILGLTIAQTIAQSPTNLSNLLLQQEDLPPSEYELPFYSGELNLKDHTQSGSFDLVAIQSKGFSQAYNSHSALILGDNSGAFMDNTILLFDSQQEAEQAFGALLTHLDNVFVAFETNTLQETGDWEETQTTALTLNDYPAKQIQKSNLQQAKILESYYTTEGYNFVVRYFIGVSDKRVFVLMVDGLPSEETEAVFRELIQKFINRQP